MTNYTADSAHTGPGSGPDAAVSALVTAVEVFIKTLAGDVPFGAGSYVLERITAVREHMDQLTFAMLAPLAQMEASGELLEAGGQKTLKAYLAHTWGLPHGEAERLMYLARNLHNQTLPKTAAAIEEGSITVGEAAAIASGAEREVKKRDAKANPDADEYRAKIDFGLAGMKAESPSMSVKSLGDAAHALGLGLNPERAEKGEEREFAARGARLTTTFGGSFTFEAWGPASDGERLKAALASFTAPYGTTNSNTDNGAAEGADATATGGAGGDLGLIPAGEAVTSRYARTYDALIAAAGFAHGHYSHTTEADDAGGGCSEPTGTKAVINVTVPLSALVAFGFTFNTDNGAEGADGASTAETTTEAETTGTAGTAGAVAAGFAATAGGAHTGTSGTGVGNTDPPTGAAPGAGATTHTSVTADTADAADHVDTTATTDTGAPLGNDVALTEDGNILALSAVRAMAPTAQIRRLIFDDRTGLPLDLGRAHRLAPGYLRTAAFIGHTTCAWSGGCDVPVSQCEADHITEFSNGGTTTATNLQPLCSTHNRLKYRRTRRTGGAGAGATTGG